jgi:AraC-like DNA-binding protein
MALQVRPMAVDPSAHGIAVVSSRHGSDFHMQKTSHPWWKCFIVRQGHGQLSSVGLSRGVCLLMAPDQPHRLEDDPAQPLWIEVICLEPARCTPARLSALQQGSTRQLDRYHLAQALRLCDGMRSELAMERPATGLATWGLFDQLLALVVRADERSEEGDDFTAACAWLDDHFREPVGLAVLAHRAGMPERTCSKRFRQLFGCNLSQWLSQRRCQHAAALIRSGHSLTDAAFLSGYQDLSFFYRQFKRIWNCTPGEFARRNG